MFASSLSASASPSVASRAMSIGSACCVVTVADKPPVTATAAAEKTDAQVLVLAAGASAAASGTATSSSVSIIVIIASGSAAPTSEAVMPTEATSAPATYAAVAVEFVDARVSLPTKVTLANEWTLRAVTLRTVTLKVAALPGSRAETAGSCAVMRSVLVFAVSSPPLPKGDAISVWSSDDVDGGTLSCSGGGEAAGGGGGGSGRGQKSHDRHLQRWQCGLAYLAVQNDEHIAFFESPLRVVSHSSPSGMRLVRSAATLLGLLGARAFAATDEVLMGNAVADEFAGTSAACAAGPLDGSPGAADVFEMFPPVVPLASDSGEQPEHTTLAEPNVTTSCDSSGLTKSIVDSSPVLEDLYEAGPRPNIPAEPTVVVVETWRYMFHKISTPIAAT